MKRHTLMRLLSTLGFVALFATAASAQVISHKDLSTSDASECLSTNCLRVTVAGMNSVVLDVTNSGTYTLKIECSSYGSIWRACKAIDQSDGSVVSEITAPGRWAIPNIGLLAVRVRRETVSMESGTPTVAFTRGFGGVNQLVFGGSATFNGDLTFDTTGLATSAKQDTIIAALGTLHTDLGTTIAGYVDGLETKLDTLHTDLGTTLHADVDGIEGKLDTLHTDIGTTLTGVLGTASDSAASAGGSGTINQHLREISAQLAAALTVTFPTSASSSAISIRCVNTAGNAFEACGGNTSADFTTTNGLLTDIKTALNDSAANDVLDGATDDASSLKPVKVGTRVDTSLADDTMLASDKRADMVADADRALITRPFAPNADLISGTASNTDGSSTQMVSAAGSGVKQYLTGLVCFNTSTTGTYVDIKSGSTTMASLPVPTGGSSNVGGAVLPLLSPLPPHAANEAWNFDPAAATTTIVCSMTGYKSKS